MSLPGESSERERDRRHRDDPPSWRPIPDPTELTTIALYREVAALREVIEEKIGALDSLIDEKFKAVQQQFQLIEDQRKELKSDNKTALDAALTAVKEQLNQMSVTFTTATTGLATIVDDVKQRVVIIEATKVGMQEKTIEQHQNFSAVYALAGFIMILLTVGGLLAVASVK